MDVCKILIATKTDLEGDRVVSTSQGEALATKFSIPFIEVSSKENKNTRECFELLGKGMV